MRDHTLLGMSRTSLAAKAGYAVAPGWNTFTRSQL